jgi:uncharacterized protein YcsI (UPF0317 family)
MVIQGDLARLNPADVRQSIRAGAWRRHTAGLAPAYAQANLVVLPRDWAYDFLLFCQRNPKPCPLLEVTEPGSAEPVGVAPGADLRTDIPRYCVYRDGRLVETRDEVRDLWQADMVGFLLGCSFTFEAALMEAGVPVRHLDDGRMVAVYQTDVACRPAGRLHGPLVVSMRPIPREQVVRAVQVTSRVPAVHGAPVHIGDPQAIGIQDVTRPDWGDAPDMRPGDVPVFWACGVTPQAVAMQARPPLMITHAPGHMFVTDVPSAQLTV